LITIIGFIIFISGNIYIFIKINEFNNDSMKLWEYCNCPIFKEKYERSRTMYTYTVICIGIIAAIQLCLSLILKYIRKF